MVKNAWDEYVEQLNVMSDDEIRKETETCLREREELDSWIDAVAAWELAGKPRSRNEDVND